MTSTPVSTWTGQYETAPQDGGELVEDAGPWAHRPRGRHRRPRPRKVLFAAGGLALAAGVLSLVRLTPDQGGVGGLGTAEAEPRPEPVAGTDDTDVGSGADTDRPAGPAVTVAPSPTAPSAMGGASTAPAPRASLVPGVPGAPTSVALTPGATYTPAAPAPRAPASGAPEGPAAPRPTSPPRTPAPAPATTAPTPQPQQPGDPRQPGVCVPVIGLCVDPLGAAVPRL
ncbi:hypothetical protein [Streptomyces rishiriensis]|uniref:Uncharacterized protein n=1 Tax=Streptomyces rishiriensis TaxID=68264 RepID=A0ABU0NXB7_STRRH|nr:hypothetical protein [Streptomyces rishiriensis]MDQ0583105.1 hypothetical protein [Streptomyces rishiriensis]